MDVHLKLNTNLLEFNENFDTFIIKLMKSMLNMNKYFGNGDCRPFLKERR